MVSAMDAAGTPIVLVHGIGDNRSAFAVLSGALRRRGFGVVHAINYSVLTALTGDVRRSAALLGAHIERICEQTGSDQVHVVGHSLGGLIARYYVQRLHGDARVRTLVTLGTPHSGTLAAYLLPTPLTKQLRPGSELLEELAEPCRSRAARASSSSGRRWIRSSCLSATPDWSTRRCTSKSTRYVIQVTFLCRLTRGLFT